MAAHDGFLQAIGDEPDDDTPRLVCADWLEENGEPNRAEFIRLQCQAALLPWDEERDALEDRADDLLDRNEDAWLGGLANVLTDWRFARGFLDYARLPGEQFRECVDDLVRTGPACRVRLSQQSADSSLSAVMRWPELECLAGLDLTEMMTEPGAAFVARSPFVKRLRQLDISGTGIGRSYYQFPLADVRALAANPAYSKLRSISLNPAGEPDRIARVLASSPVLASLRALSLRGNSITDEGARILANSSSLSALTALDLQAMDASAKSVGYLAIMPLLHSLTLTSRQEADEGNSLLTSLRDTGLLGRLELLGLRFEGQQQTDAHALISYSGPARLKELNLNGGMFRYASLMSLASAPLLEAVERLNLRSCHLEGSNFPLSNPAPLSRLRALSVSSTNLQTASQYLASRGYLARLRFFMLSSTGMWSAGLAAVLDGMERNRLRSLKLADNPLQDGGLEMLAAAPGLGRLRELDLSRTGATAEGVQQLLASTRLPRLRVLRLSGTDLDGLNVEELLESPVVAGLRMLDLSSTRRLTGDDIDDLKDALGRRVNLQYAGDDY